MKPNDNTQNVWKDNSPCRVKDANREIMVLTEQSEILCGYYFEIPETGYSGLKGSRLHQWSCKDRWCYSEDYIKYCNDLQVQVDELKKQLKDACAGLYCGHCAQTAKASHIWAKKNQDLQAENDRYKKALEFYASQDIHKKNNSDDCECFVLSHGDIIFVEDGTIARTALTKKEQ